MKNFATVISISNKTGFESISNPVLIFDESGDIFYNYSPKGGRFNLPAGRYFTNSIVKVLPQPLKYKLPQKPKPDRFLKPKNLKLSVKNNPNTATVYLKKSVIVIDAKKWNSLRKPEKDFILYHEIGHFFYISEKAADIFAVRQMLKAGYNPSQCFAAPMEALRNSGSKVLRCTHILNEITK